jgi:hypothetical protein
MKLVCYRLPDRAPPDIHPAGVGRTWMDRTRERHAYRCLPLDIASSHGWEIRCRSSFEATWSGSRALDAIRIEAEGEGRPDAESHFGDGVLTFPVGGLFRTPPGWNLVVMGPPNAPKPGIQPLTGIVETDWLPFTFTMNWLFTDADRPVRFARGEPYCFVFPVQRGVVEDVEPEFRDLESDPELLARYEEWAEGRDAFNAALADPDSDARRARWQRHYHLGRLADGTPFAEAHQTRVRARPFPGPER